MWAVVVWPRSHRVRRPVSRKTQNHGVPVSTPLCGRLTHRAHHLGRGAHYRQLEAMSRALADQAVAAAFRADHVVWNRCRSPVLGGMRRLRFEVVDQQVESSGSRRRAPPTVLATMPANMSPASGRRFGRQTTAPHAIRLVDRDRAAVADSNSELASDRR